MSKRYVTIIVGSAPGRQRLRDTLALPRTQASGARRCLLYRTRPIILSQVAALLQPYLKPMELPNGAILYRAEEMISRVYFPHAGVVSLIVGLSGGQFIEAGMFGRNSVIGVGALLDGPFALYQAIGQVGGSGVGADVSVLRDLMERSKTLRASLAGYERMFSAHAQQVAACNAVHQLDERLSRWLLQVRDLIQSDDLPLTQEFLSQMLGVQRSSVTLVARRLQEAGLITYQRQAPDGVPITKPQLHCSR